MTITLTADERSAQRKLSAKHYGASVAWGIAAFLNGESTETAANRLRVRMGLSAGEFSAYYGNPEGMPLAFAATLPVLLREFATNGRTGLSVAQVAESGARAIEANSRSLLWLELIDRVEPLARRAGVAVDAVLALDLRAASVIVATYPLAGGAPIYPAAALAELNAEIRHQISRLTPPLTPYVPRRHRGFPAVA